MEIPKIIASYSLNSTILLDDLIETVSISKKDKEKGIEFINIFLQLDLDKKAITFEYRPHKIDSSENEFNYFGNNSAAGAQVYAVRSSKSFINFWTGRPRGIFQNLYEFLKEGELKDLLKECRDEGLFNDKGIVLNKITPSIENLSVNRDEKSFYMGEEKVPPEKFLLALVKGSSIQKPILIIPKIIKNKEENIISCHKEYQNAIMNSLQTSTKNTTKAVCHICGKLKDDIDTESTTKLSRSSISKVFGTTTVNYAYLFKKENHQKNYSLCRECFEKIYSGENRVMKDFTIRIAGESAVFLVEEVIDKIDTNKIQSLKKDVQSAFSMKNVIENAEDIVTTVRDIEEISLFSFNVVFYFTDGKSCSVFKTIEDISNIRFIYIKSIFEQVRERFGKLLPNFKLGYIYGMIPVFVNKKNEQLNIARVLDLYSIILKDGLVEKNHIFDMACEALEKGLNEMWSSQIRNYKNLNGLERLSKLDKNNDNNKSIGKEYFIRNMTLYYLALFQVLQKLNILDKEVFLVEEKNNDSILENNDLSDYIIEKEEFLNKHGFNNSAKALFYLGSMMYEVGEAQRVQGHKDKPILSKMTYTGMDHKEVISFYGEIMEKLFNQYRKKIYMQKCQQLLHQFYKYAGSVDEFKSLTEKENVFYIMSGYGFCVNMKKAKKINNDDNDDIEIEEKDNDNM